MIKPTQTQLAAQGIEILRQEFIVGCYDGEAEKALRALCDYAERTIEARKAGGKSRWEKSRGQDRRGEREKAGEGANVENATPWFRRWWRYF